MLKYKALIWGIIGLGLFLFLANIYNNHILNFYKDSDQATKSEVFQYGSGLNVTYSQVLRDLEGFGFDMQQAPLASGEARMMGQSDKSKAATILEVVGTPEATNRATLTVAGVTDREINLGNIVVVDQFLKNTVSEWPEAMIWANKAFDKVSKGSDDQSIIKFGKKINISFSKELALFFITVTNKDHITS